MKKNFEKAIKSLKEKVDMVDEGIKPYTFQEEITKYEVSFWNGYKAGVENALMEIEYLYNLYLRGGDEL